MKDLGKLENWTRVELARVIVQALFNAPVPPAADNVHVKRELRAKKATLIRRATYAIHVLNNEQLR